MNYYNEFDPHAAEWLRQLIKLGTIPDGFVDERSIVDLKSNDLEGFKQCHFFAGIGVWSYAIRQAGWPDDRPVWTGSCPCQSFSTVGNQKGKQDERHLWPVWYRLIRECQPEIIFGEQVASSSVIGKVRGGGSDTWIDSVQADLERARYAAGFAVLPACGFGSSHIRQRLWYVGTKSTRMGNASLPRRSNISEQPAILSTTDKDKNRNQIKSVVPGDGEAGGKGVDWLDFDDGKRRPIEPGSFPLVDGFAVALGQSGDISEQETKATTEAGRERIKGYGNAITVPCATEFIKVSMQLV